MKRSIQLVLRFVAVALVLGLSLPVSADMNRAECKRNCDQTVKTCLKVCKDHGKNPKAVRKCKSNCNKLGKVCKQQCNKRQ